MISWEQFQYIMALQFWETSLYKIILLTSEIFLSRTLKKLFTIILECYVDADDIENELYQAGLDSFLYAHDSSSNWPNSFTTIN